MTKGIIITVSGSVARVEVDGLDEMQAAVGGLIEPAEGSIPGYGFDIYVNEEGIGLQLEPNVIASSLTRYRTHLFGDAVLLGSVDDEGGVTDLPGAVVEFVSGIVRAALR
jgi:hypothetical protein